jgi:hypothetical protein
MKETNDGEKMDNNRFAKIAKNRKEQQASPGLQNIGTKIGYQYHRRRHTG